MPLPKSKAQVIKKDRELEQELLDNEFRETMENSMHPRPDINYDDIRPVPIPPFIFPNGTSFRE